MKNIKRKLKAAVCLALALLCLCPALPAQAAVDGDIDGDGEITGGDARMVLRFAVLLDAPTTEQRLRSDLDGDGAITSADARLTLRLAVGLGPDFETILYATAHQYDRLIADLLPPVDNWIENGYRQIDKWCCYYTIHDVFRPALKKAGYSKERIDQLAPNSFEGSKVRDALHNTTSITIPSVFFERSNSVYIPSLLADYYRTHGQYCTTYTFTDYYDDVLNEEFYSPSENRWSYHPRVGDILFISHHTDTYYMGYPTIDHTAQIIRVYDDDNFLCTEGSIYFDDGSDLPRVCERQYTYNYSVGGYELSYDSSVRVLMIASPDL